MDVYETLVDLTRLEILKTPDITDDQLDGFVKYLGVFVPKVRKRIIKEAKTKK